MSTKVTVTETNGVSLSAPSKLSCSIQALQRKDVLLMFFESVIAAVCFGLMQSSDQYVESSPALVATIIFNVCLHMSFFATALLFISHLISPMAAEILPKTSFQFLHNILAFLFYFTSGLAYVTLISKEHHKTSTYEKEVAASVLGLGNAALYFLSTFLSYKSFKSS